MIESECDTYQKSYASYGIAEIYNAFGDTEKSLYFQNLAVENNPHNFRFIDGLARQYFKYGRFESAEHLVEKSLSIQNNNFSDKDPFTPVLYSRILNSTGKSAKALNFIGNYIIIDQKKIYVDSLNETLRIIDKKVSTENWKDIWG